MNNNVIKRLNKFIKKTPLEYCERLSKIFDCNIYLKREDLQITRSFKARGSLNKIIKNIDNYNKFVCASAGNHAQGVAYISNLLNVQSKIYVPKVTPSQKISRILKIGCSNIRLIKYGKNFSEALEYAKINTTDDELFIHPYDDYDIIEGQSTIGKEITDVIKPDVILTCVGGGGLVSGLLSYFEEYNMENNKYLNGSKNNSVKIIGIEPDGANSMQLSLEKKKIINMKNIDTFVDGASVSKVGNITFDICNKNNLEIKTVSNNELSYNMVDLYNNEGIITEPAGILSISGLNKIDSSYLKNKNVICIISGGNNDITRYPEIVERSLIHLGIKHYFIIKFNQNPNELKNFVNNILGKNDDITRFEYIKKTNKTFGNILICIETLDIESLIEHLRNSKYEYIKLKDNNILYKYLV